MADAFLFDTSAFITLTDREPGVDRVRELLSAARRGEMALYACFVSLTEVQYIKTYDDGPEKARRIMNAIQRFSQATAEAKRQQKFSQRRRAT